MMHEERVREIVREELARCERDRAASARAVSDQALASHREKLSAIAVPKDGDGPLVSEMKALMRGAYTEDA